MSIAGSNMSANKFLDKVNENSVQISNLLKNR